APLRPPEPVSSENAVSPPPSYAPAPAHTTPAVVQPMPETPKIVARSDAPRPPVSPAAALPASGQSAQGLPPLKLVNSKEVVLEYQLDKVGPSGVGSVELWLTDNDGQSWQRFAEDPDAKVL